MNNVIKHAKTNKVYLDLSQNVEYLEIDIRDNVKVLTRNQLIRFI